MRRLNYGDDEKISNIEDINFDNGNIIIMGLQPETDYQIYDVLGKMLYTGMTDANGSAEISLSTGHLIIIKQNDTVIKIRC